MATLVPYLQRFEDLRDGSIIGIHKLKLLSASDTFTVPALANSTNSASSDQVRASGEAAVTVTDNADNTITLAGGVAGNTCTIVSHHHFINSGSES